MTAIIEAGGKQYLVKTGDKIQVEKIDGQPGDSITFENVLFADGKIGKPTVAGAQVTGKVTKQGRARKIVILKYKAKSKYRKKQGHRQHYTEVEITKA